MFLELNTVTWKEKSNFLGTTTSRINTAFLWSTTLLIFLCAPVQNFSDILSQVLWTDRLGALSCELSLLNVQRRADALSELIYPIKCQWCSHIETSQLNCAANQLTCFYIRAALAFSGLKWQQIFSSKFSKYLTTSSYLSYLSWKGFSFSSHLRLLKMKIL